MAIWPFNRNKSEETYQTQEQLPVEQPASNLPDEVQEYYQSGKRERVGVAWLLGIATLCVTLILAMALFFGGRWVYRKIANRNDKPNTTSQIGQNNQNKQNGGNSSTNQGKQSPTPSTPETKPSTPTPAPTTPAPAPTTIPSTNQPGTSQPAPTTVPNTGPGDVVAIFVLTTVVGTVGFYAYQLRRQQ